MSRIGTIVCTLFFVLLFNASIVFAANAMFGEVAAVTLNAELEAGRQVVVYDIRTEGEYLEGHVPGAINILPQSIRSIASKLPGNKRQPIVFYCRGTGCTLSRVAATEAYKLGHEDIRIFPGGMPSWSKSGYPVAK